MGIVEQVYILSIITRYTIIPPINVQIMRSLERRAVDALVAQLLAKVGGDARVVGPGAVLTPCSVCPLACTPSLRPPRPASG